MYFKGRLTDTLFISALMQLTETTSTALIGRYGLDWRTLFPYHFQQYFTTVPCLKFSAFLFLHVKHQHVQ